MNLITIVFIVLYLRFLYSTIITLYMQLFFVRNTCEKKDFNLNKKRRIAPSILMQVRLLFLRLRAGRGSYIHILHITHC